MSSVSGNLASKSREVSLRFLQSLRSSVVKGALKVARASNPDNVSWWQPDTSKVTSLLAIDKNNNNDANRQIRHLFRSH